MISGWEQKRLADVIETVATIDPTRTPDKPFKYVDVSSISNKTFEIEGVQELLGRDAPSRARRHIRCGDVLFATIRPTLKRIAVVPEDLHGEVCSTGYFVFRPKHFLDGRYLFYFLMTPQFMDEMEKIQTGASYPAVNDAQVKSQLIQFPPLFEQKRIVVILDETFEGIAKATANAERNLVNARELPEALLENALEPQDDWEETALANIAEFKNGLNFTRMSKGETIRMVGVKDFQNEYWVPDRGLEYVTIDGKLPLGYELRPRDILTVRSNGNKQLIGRCIIAGDVPEKTSHSGFTIRIRVTSPKINPEFLAYALKNRSIRTFLVSSGGGANISSLNQGALSSLPVTFPSLTEQTQIVAKIHLMMNTCKQLQDARGHRLSQLDELKRSLLQKAFSGRLTGKEDIAA